MHDVKWRSERGSTSGGFVSGILAAGLVAFGGYMLLDIEVVRGGVPPQSPTTAAPTTVTASAAPQETIEAEELSTEELVAQVASGVVRIEATRCEGTATGSGALISSDLVLTAAHMVQGHTAIKVMLGGEVASARVVGYAPEDDLAILRTSTPLTGHVFDVREDSPPIGTEIFALGYPLSGPLSFTGPGVISNYGEEAIYTLDDQTLMEVGNLFQMSVLTNRGNSGGPVVNRVGEIVGVVSGGHLSKGEPGTVVGGEDVLVDIIEGHNYATQARTISERLALWELRAAPLDPVICDEEPSSPVRELVSATTAGPTTELVRDVLFDYFDGVNTGDYERAYRQLSEERRNLISFERFEEEFRTSFVSDVVVLAISEEGDDVLADTTFTSHQAPEFGPEPGQICTYWTNRFWFIPGGEHGLLIAGTRNTEDSPPFQACN